MMHVLSSSSSVKVGAVINFYALSLEMYFDTSLSAQIE